MSLKKHIEEFEKNFDESLDYKVSSKDVVTFNSDGNIKFFKEQYKNELAEKDRVIENLKQELNSQWLTNQTAFNTKKMYEDKIKKMDIVDSTNLIPTLMEVSKQKQGDVKLDWMSWLEIPESNYLFQINESLAKKVFQENNLLIDRLRYRKGRGGDAPTKNYALSFSGDRSGATKTFVSTTFNPDTYSLWNGFTISFWVRPDAVSTSESDTVPMFVLGRKHNANQRFTFGINTNKAIYVAFGGKKITTNYLAMGVNTNPNLSHLLNDDNSLKTGNWINFVITYADRSDVTDDADLKIYMNGELIKTNDDKWTQQGGNTAGLMLGARNLVGGTRSEPSTPGTFNNGWACGLDEVAIYDTGKGTSFAQEVYNGGINYDHKGASGLVAYWKMNEGSGNTVIDHSGNGYNGTLETDGTGEPTWEEIKRYK